MLGVGVTQILIRDCMNVFLHSRLVLRSLFLVEFLVVFWFTCSALSAWLGGPDRGRCCYRAPRAMAHLTEAWCGRSLSNPLSADGGHLRRAHVPAGGVAGPVPLRRRPRRLENQPRLQR